MSILRSKKKILIAAAVCLLAALTVLAAVWIDRALYNKKYETFTIGDDSTGFLRIHAPRELELNRRSHSGERTLLRNPVNGTKNMRIIVEQATPAHLSTVERDGNLDVYATELMHRIGLSGECELQEFGDFLFFERVGTKVYDRYSDDPKTYMGYDLIVVYRANGQQGHIEFTCHADDKDTYREIFFDLVRSMEFL